MVFSAQQTFSTKTLFRLVSHKKGIVVTQFNTCNVLFSFEGLTEYCRSGEKSGRLSGSKPFWAIYEEKIFCRALFT